MNNEMEMAINLRDLLYCVLKRWRSIMLGAVVCALLAGFFKFSTGILNLRDEEIFAREESRYENTLNDFAAEGRNLEQRIVGLQGSVSAQQEYNGKSHLMAIDPMEKYVGTLVVYVDSGYQIDPNLTYQNIDLTHRLVTAYGAYLHSGETYDLILEETEIVDEVPYLAEILTYSVDPEAASIMAQCVGGSEEEVRNILRVVESCIRTKYPTIQKTIGTHSYGVLMESVYSTVDLDLYNIQQENIQKVSDGLADLAEVKASLEAWEKMPEPKKEFGEEYAIKESIKFVILGGIIGGILMVMVYAVIYLLSQTVKIDSDWEAFGLPVLGRVYSDPEKKVFGKLDRWLDLYIGNRRKTTRDVSCQLAGRNLGAVLKERDLSSCVLVGDIDAVLAEEVTAKMNRAADGVRFRCAGNILIDSEAIDRMGETAEVVLLAKNYTTTYDNIKETRMLLTAWGKTIVGVITIS